MNDLTGLARESLRRAVERSAGDLSGALEAFGWRELAESDEPFAFSALFEELGRLGLCTDALDLAIVALTDLDAPASVVWPGTRGSDETDHARSPLSVDGIALRSLRQSGQTILAPLGDRVFVLEADLVDEEPLGGMAEGYGWVRVHASGACGAEVGSWPEMDRRARLSVASELVAVTQKIMEVATEQVSTRRQFGRPIGANQSVRFRLAEGFAEVAGARALIAAAWEDGSGDASVWAKAAAGVTHDSVSKHALQVCGAIGLSDEHPLPPLVRRGFCLDAFLGSASELGVRFGGRDQVPVGSY
jgi:Acyl-CoA dehydrogenase, C-terminal domain